MKKKVRVKSKSFCPLSNEGVHSQLNEIQDMLDTLSKFVVGEAKKAEAVFVLAKLSLPAIKPKGELTQALLRYSNFCVIVSSV